MTQEEIIKKFNELGFNNLGNKAVSDKILSFILQVRTDTINEIRKEVERLQDNAKIFFNEEDIGLLDCATYSLEDIKTFLNNLDK